MDISDISSPRPSTYPELRTPRHKRDDGEHGSRVPLTSALRTPRYHKLEEEDRFSLNTVEDPADPEPSPTITSPRGRAEPEPRSPHRTRHTFRMLLGALAGASLLYAVIFVSGPSIESYLAGHSSTSTSTAKESPMARTKPRDTLFSKPRHVENFEDPFELSHQTPFVVLGLNSSRNFRAFASQGKNLFRKGGPWTFENTMKVFSNRIPSFEHLRHVLSPPRSTNGKSLARDRSRAFATYIHLDMKSPGPVYGLIALLASWRVSHTYEDGSTKHPYYVFAVQQLPQKFKQSLEKAFDVEVLQMPDPFLRNMNPRGSNPDTYTSARWNRLAAFNVTGVQRLVLLDSDVLIHQNVDEMARFPHLSAVRSFAGSCGHTDKLSSGVLVIKPNSEDFKKILEYRQRGQSCKTGKDFTGGEEELLSCLTGTRSSGARPHHHRRSDSDSDSDSDPDRWAAPERLRLGDVTYQSFQFHGPVSSCSCSKGRGEGSPLTHVNWRQAHVRLGHFAGVRPWEAVQDFMSGKRASEDCTTSNVLLWWHYAALGFKMVGAGPTEVLNWFDPLSG